MPPRPARLAPLLPALAVLLGGYASLEAAARSLSGRPYTFPLDDAYIHLAVARTLAETATWGVNPGDYASASSSPVWTVLLSVGFALIGPQPLLALFLNLGAALGVLAIAAGWLGREGVPSAGIAAGLIALVLILPLPFLAGIGMEHGLQLLLALWLVSDRAAPPWRAGLLAAALTMTRYESVVLPVALALAAARDRRFPVAGALVVGPLLAVTGFGLFGTHHGATFLPAGVLLKASPGLAVLGILREAPGLVVLVVAVALAGGPGRGVYLLAAAAQLLLGRVGWFYRYKAWLVGWGVLLLIPGAARPGWRGRVALGVALIALVPRAAEAIRRYPYAARFMADTDFTLADWLARDWAGSTVGVHNLGVIAWQGRVRVVDVAGLGTAPIAQAIADHRLTPEMTAQVLRDRGVAFVVGARDWRGGGTPPGVTELAAVWAPFPVPPGEFESTVVWVVDAAVQPELRRSFGAIDWSERVRVVEP